MSGGAVDIENFGIRKLLAAVSVAALVVSCCLPASAAEYTAANRGELDNAIRAANADADANATIRLTGSFSVNTTSLVIPTKPVTIDTQGFTLSGQAGSGAPGTQINFSGAGAMFTLVGNFKGGNSDTAAGGQGLLIRLGAAVTNNGVVAGGDSLTGSGSIGVDIGGPGAATTFVNNGTVRGGTGAAGGPGLQVRAGAINPLINTGTIEGGNGAVAIRTNGATVSLNLTNSGIIRAGAGQANAIVLAAGATNGVTLELQAGSVIEGNVVGNAAAANDKLRLGGTGSDSFDVSTIGPQYQNFDTFEKTGTGTWSLTGTGTEATNWDIQAGTLQIGNGGMSGSVIGDVTNNATLAFNRSDAFTFDNLIFGNGTIRQIGSGRTILTADNSAFAGNTIVEAGTLSVNGILGGTLDVVAGGRLQGNGQIGTTDNAGTIAPGNSIGTLTISGNYTGSGGTLEIETVLGGDASPSDRLVVTGNTSGTTDVKVTNLGGGGAQTVEGIKIVDVGGTSAGNFSLLGDFVFEGDQAVVAGAYAYRLYQGGASTPADGDWYLRSTLLDLAGTPIGPIYAPGVPLYEAYAGVLQSLNEFGTLRQRTGGREVDDGQSADDAGSAPAGAIWTRIDGTHSHFEPETSTTGTEYDVNSWTLQAGVDGMLQESGAGALIGGVSFHVDTASADISSRFGKGNIDTTGYGFDGTLTWYGNSGFYVDTQAGVTWYSSDLKSSTLDTMLADGNDGFGYGFSVEAGQKIAVTSQWSLTPQAQLAYSSVRFDSFTDQYGADVSLDDGDSLTGRLGISADHNNDWKDASGKSGRSKIYGIANLYYDFLDGSDVDVSGASLVNESQALWGGLGVGGSLSWSDDRYAVSGEAFARTSLKDFGDSNTLGAKVGFSVKW